MCGECKYIILEANYDDIVIPGVDSTTIVFRYNRPLEIMWKFAKHEGFFEIAEFAGEIMAEAIMGMDPGFLSGASAVYVPVPLSREKYRRRGFNQVDKVLLGMSKYLNSHYAVDIELRQLLSRERNTKTQIGQNRTSRKGNIGSAFIANKMPMPAKVTIVDDISTTGGTLEGCARALRDAGVKRVEALVFARG